MSNTMVQIDEKWVRRVNSPLYLLVATLTGVSVTFVPLCLYWLGLQQARFADARVLLCLVVIYAIPLFYMRLAGDVIRQIHGAKATTSASKVGQDDA